MYGLIFENFVEYIKEQYGAGAWEEIRQLSGVEMPTFNIHQVYKDNLISRMAKKTCQSIGCTEDEFFEGMGKCFVKFLKQFGYGDVLALLGRELRDFLNGLDNLHEYLKYSYPRLRAPSYFCDNETDQGLHLYYRSKRRGFVYYTVGQLKAVASAYYNISLDIKILEQAVRFDTLHVTFELSFDNSKKKRRSSDFVRNVSRLPAVSSSILFSIFPFVITYDDQMVIKSIGTSLQQMLPSMVGKKISEYFTIVRPLVEFRFEVVLSRQNNIFELCTTETIDHLLEDEKRQRQTDNKDGDAKPANDDDEAADVTDLNNEEDEKYLRMKGQMLYMADWNVVMFLASPSLTSLDELADMGMYINDLSISDFSRDLLLASTNKSNTLREALEAEEKKTEDMEKAMTALAKQQALSEDLLTMMIPKSMIDKVKEGSNPAETCEVFEAVSIVFNDIPGFLEMSTKCDGMEIVNMLNTLFGYYDVLSDKNGVFKVETVKDSFVASAGAPDRIDDHAVRIANMALDMRDVAQYIDDPRPAAAGEDQAAEASKKHICVRLGCHTGMVVAGIVGNKMPRYCLFGDAMNTASRMMSNGAEQCINISSSMQAALPPNVFQMEKRGTIMVKGKGEMETYWLKDKTMRTPPSKEELNTELEKIKNKNSFNQGDDNAGDGGES